MQNNGRRTTFWHGLCSLILMVGIMFAGIVVMGADPQVPLIFGCLVAAVMAMVIGFRWNDILDGMLKGIGDSLEAILILMLIGMLVGTWIASGTMPTLIYYGLHILSPKIFLPVTVLLCMLVAFAIGSWGTIGTIGLAFMGIGTAFGLSPAVVAGAVVSGAYAGEVISPLSDATNLSSAVTGDNIFVICHHSMRRMIPTMVIVLLLFTVHGLRSDAAGSGSTEAVRQLMDAVDALFVISPWALLPIAAMAACLFFRMPAIPSMLLGSIGGMLTAVILQHASLHKLLAICYRGFVSHTGDKIVDDLLSAGGIQSMFYTISIIIIAMAFGGIMSRTGQMDAFVRPVVGRCRGEGSLAVLTTVTAALVNFVIPDQYLGISMPGEMYKTTYQKRHVRPYRLACSILGSGAVTSPMIPWNTCGLYCTTILGVSTMQYASHAYLCMLLPLVTIVIGCLDARGKKTDDEGNSRKVNRAG